MGTPGHYTIQIYVTDEQGETRISNLIDHLTKDEACAAAGHAIHAANIYFRDLSNEKKSLEAARAERESLSPAMRPGGI